MLLNNRGIGDVILAISSPATSVVMPVNTNSAGKIS
jgi:hypothetical protein